MGNHRMFANAIIDSDSFLDMPLSTQALYFHLGMKADDDGFVGSPKRLARSVSCTEDDLKLLIAKGYIIPFDSGVVAIAHWNVHNKIRKDRKKETFYQDEKQLLSVTVSNVYTTDPQPDNQPATTCQPNDNQSATNCQPSDNQLSAQGKVSQDKISQDKVSEGKISQEKIRKGKPLSSTAVDAPSRTPYGIFHNVLLTEDELNRLKSRYPYDYEAKIERLSRYLKSTGKRYSNHYATLLSWLEEDAAKSPPQYEHRASYDLSELEKIDTLDFVDEPDFQHEQRHVF